MRSIPHHPFFWGAAHRLFSFKTPLLRLSVSKEMARLSCTNAILSLMWRAVEIGCLHLLCNIQTAFEPLPIPSFLSCNCFPLLWELKRLNTPLIICNWRSQRVPWAALVWEDLLVGSTQCITARAVAQGRGILGLCASPILLRGGVWERRVWSSNCF